MSVVFACLLPFCRLCGLNRISISYHASAVGSHASRTIPVHTLSCFSGYGWRRGSETNSPAAGRIWGMVSGDDFAGRWKNMDWRNVCLGQGVADSRKHNDG